MFIPPELAELPNWVNFSVEDGKKIPYISGTAHKARSNDPTTWRTLEEAQKDGRLLGFALQHPYIFIDLDEEHPEILKTFDTYAQTSYSGEGVHLIGRGFFEGDGVHPKSPDIGVFKENRFCLWTADILDDRDEIKDLGDIQDFYDWVSKNKTTYSTANLVEIEPTTEDKEVWKRCAKRFTSFENLWNGEAGDDHSVSDHTLIHMLADECESNEQIRRMFFASALCREHRKTPGYVDRTLRKARGKQEEEKKIFEAVTVELSENKIHEEPVGDKSLIESMPNGVLKEIALWHHRTSYYPLQEASIAVTLAAAATVCGRTFQAQGNLGLNPWIIVVGASSCGKSEYNNGLQRLFNTVAANNELGLNKNYAKMLGGKIASGEGLEDILARQKKINAYFPEFHEIYEGLTQTGKARHLSTLKEQMLALHGQAKRGAFLKRRIKAYKEDEKIPDPVEAPCLVVSGETTPGEFYGLMSSKDINNGWLQRFIILNVRNSSVSIKKQLNQEPIPLQLLNKIEDVFSEADSNDLLQKFTDVKLSKEAQVYLDRLEEETRINNFSGDPLQQSSNRVSMKAFQISALFAVWEDTKNPVVTLEQAKWSYEFAKNAEDELKKKFSVGDIGSGQVKQEAEVRKTILRLHAMSVPHRIRSGIPEDVAKHRDVVPYMWLKDQIVMLSCFENDRNGAVSAFERCMHHMQSAGEIKRISAVVAKEEYGREMPTLISFT